MTTRRIWTVEVWSRFDHYEGTLPHQSQQKQSEINMWETQRFRLKHQGIVVKLSMRWVVAICMIYLTCQSQTTYLRKITEISMWFSWASLMDQSLNKEVITICHEIPYQTFLFIIIRRHCKSACHRQEKQKCASAIVHDIGRNWVINNCYQQQNVLTVVRYIPSIWDKGWKSWWNPMRTLKTRNRMDPLRSEIEARKPDLYVHAQWILKRRRIEMRIPKQRWRQSWIPTQI